MGSYLNKLNISTTSREMLKILFLNILLLCQLGLGVADDINAQCPYPLPEVIQPCKCFADQNYKVGLICDLQEDMTGEILGRVTSSLACTTIDTLIVNLNNNSWKTDLNAANF